MTTNPYAAPQGGEGEPPREGWRTTWLAPFLSSMLTIPGGLAVLGVFRRGPDLLLKPDFILPLIVGAAVSASVLCAYSSANWLVRAILAPPIAFVVYFAGAIAWSYVWR
jgi:hypothetical protein